MLGLIGFLPVSDSNRREFTGFRWRPGHRTRGTAPVESLLPRALGVIQPLSGEYAGRREAFEKAVFFSGYRVEKGLLIDVFEQFGLGAIAQVDLLERIHRNQGLEALSKMSFAIIQTVLRKIEIRSERSILEDVNKTMKLIRHISNGYFLAVEEIAEQERPPMISLPAYRDRNK
jgi:glucosyl-3-phosphoglycerate synthase